MDLIETLDKLCDATRDLADLCREQAKIIEQARLVDAETMKGLTERRKAAETILQEVNP